jgi:monothiol glutaredoxin
MNNRGENPFKLAAVPQAQPAQAQSAAGEQPGDSSQIARVEGFVGSADVFVFIKGTPQQPMCGFSANTVAVLDSMGVRYRHFDVLSDEGVRDAAKRFARWPTFPQVYVRGEFVGGNDIISEMAVSGELRQLFEGHGS